MARLVISTPTYWQHYGYGGDDLASIYLSLAGRSRYPFSQRNAGLDDASLPNQRSRRPLDGANRYRVLAAFLGPSNCGRHTASLAETAAAFDAPAGSAEHLPDFCAVWLSGSPTEKAGKSARMATRQAKNPETTLCCGQKDIRSG